MRKCVYIALALPLLVLMAVSCDDGKYESNGEIVRYSYWTFSFGTVYDTLPDADPATFHSVNSWLGCDHERVYFKNNLVPDADVSSLKADRYPLFHDKNGYYYESTPMRVADMATFKVMKWEGDNFWAKDSRCAYFDTVRIDNVDLPTFKIVDSFTAIDRNHVYRFGEILLLADPATFEPHWKDLYSRDKSHIWYGNELLEDVDYDSFVVDDEGNARDKYGAFKGGERVAAEADN